MTTCDDYSESDSEDHKHHNLGAGGAEGHIITTSHVGGTQGGGLTPLRHLTDEAEFRLSRGDVAGARRVLVDVHAAAITRGDVTALAHVRLYTASPRWA